MKRKALGKGLSALLPEPEPAQGAAAPAGAATQELPLDLIDPNPQQPRQVLDETRLAELAASIAESGIVQPILVRPHGPRFEIVAGERRWRAAQIAGLTSVPVVVREIPDDRLLEVALVENIQRQELSAIEEAQAYQRLQSTLELSQEEVARKVGKDRTTVANTLRLLRLPPEIQDLVGRQGLDAGHARALLALDNREAQLELAKEASRAGLSVREVERRVALARAPRSRVEPRRDPNTVAASERLRGVLGTPVEIVRRGKGGRIEIRFTSESELNRLYEALVRVGRPR